MDEYHCRISSRESTLTHSLLCFISQRVWPVLLFKLPADFMQGSDNTHAVNSWQMFCLFTNTYIILTWQAINNYLALESIFFRSLARCLEVFQQRVQVPPNWTQTHIFSSLACISLTLEHTRYLCIIQDLYDQVYTHAWHWKQFYRQIVVEGVTAAGIITIPGMFFLNFQTHNLLTLT